MAIGLQLNINGKQGQYTYQDTVANLVSSTTPLIIMSGGIRAYTIIYTLTGAGSLQIQKSANDPRESLNTATPLTQLWLNTGTAATGGAAQGVEGAGSPSMFRGVVTGAAGTDVVTITVNTAI